MMTMITMITMMMMVAMVVLMLRKPSIPGMHASDNIPSVSEAPTPPLQIETPGWSDSSGKKWFVGSSRLRSREVELAKAKLKQATAAWRDACKLGPYVAEKEAIKKRAAEAVRVAKAELNAAATGGKDSPAVDICAKERWTSDRVSLHVRLYYPRQSGLLVYCNRKKLSRAC